MAFDQSGSDSQVGSCVAKKALPTDSLWELALMAYITPDGLFAIPRLVNGKVVDTPLSKEEAQQYLASWVCENCTKSVLSEAEDSPYFQ